MHFGGMGGGMRFGGMAISQAAASAFAGSRVGFACRLRGPRFAHAGFPSRPVLPSPLPSLCVHWRWLPYAYAAYDSCWRRTWTPYGLQWVNVCGDYGYY